MWRFEFSNEGKKKKKERDGMEVYDEERRVRYTRRRRLIGAAWAKCRIHWRGPEMIMILLCRTMAAEDEASLIPCWRGQVRLW